MAPGYEFDMRPSDDNNETPTHHRPLHEAVTRFGQLAVDQQMRWIFNTVSKRLKEGNIIIPYEIRPQDVHQHRRHTCALPMCPNFNQPSDAGEHCISIERHSNLHLADKLYRPSASLAMVRATWIGEELNLRGRGETGCFQFHIACGELVLSQGAYTDTPTFTHLPTASLPMGDFAHLIRVEPHHSRSLGYQTRLDPPDMHAILKWIAVVQAERGVAGMKTNEGWLEDDGLAVYSSQKHSEYVGRWHQMLIEFTARQIKGHLLSTVLIRVKRRKRQASKEKNARQRVSQVEAAGVPKQATLDVGTGREEDEMLEESATTGTSEGSPGPSDGETRVAVEDNDAAIKEPANLTERENEEGGETEEEEEEEEDEDHLTVVSGISRRRIAQHTRQARDGVLPWLLGVPDPHWRMKNSENVQPSTQSASEDISKGDVGTEDRLSEGSADTKQLSNWDKYLKKGRRAFRRAAKSDDGWTEGSTPEGECIEATPSEAGESSTESLRWVPPLMRFVIFTDSEDSSSGSSNSPEQEVPVQNDESSSEEDGSLESWSDPDQTLATIHENAGLAMRLF